MVKNLKRFDFVPVEYIIKRFERKYTQKEIIARIKKLTKLKLLTKHQLMNAYRITFTGLDCVTLNYLALNNIVKAIGDIIGVGKESEVYRGVSETDEIVAIKLYRIGRQSFKHIAKHRGYYEGMERRWIVRSIVAGKREREALTILNEYTIPGIPKIYGGLLHCVVIEYIDGYRLNENVELSDPQNAFHQIIETIKRAYNDAGIVHGDLSEYNIIITLRDEEEKVYIIDWPQYASATMPIAAQLLKHDIENITKFFKRRYRLDIDPQKVLKYVLENKA